jgi:hypothetical protein
LRSEHALVRTGTWRASLRPIYLTLYYLLLLIEEEITMYIEGFQDIKTDTFAG